MNDPMILQDPDCTNGKHDNCKGEGWNLELDCVDQCPCICHEIKGELE